jgi:hypothetical protein
MDDQLSRDQVEALREALTMVDIYRARKLTKETVEIGLEAYHQAALRLGVVPGDASLEDFLVMIRADDFNEIMGAARSSNPLPSGGESGPDFSAGTDTPRPSSSG